MTEKLNEALNIDALSQEVVVKEDVIFQRKIGRIRDIQVHPKNGKIYFLSKKSLWVMEKV